MAQKIKRTLGPAAFEAYMEFADSLRTPENSDAIDRFKYDFAVMEGYITPKKKKPLTEGQLGLGDFEKAFQGLVGAFLPHLDEDEQAILGTVCDALDQKINSGDLGGAQDILHGAMQDAGGTPDSFQVDEECCMAKPKVEAKSGSKFHPEDDCPHIFGANDPWSIKFPTDSDFPEDYAMGAEKELDFDTDYAHDDYPEDFPADEECCDKPVTETFDGRPPHELDDDRFPADDNSIPYRPESPAGIDGVEDYSFEDDTNVPLAATDELDYDALADQLLSDSGHANLTGKYGGIRPENQKFWP